ncbi:C-type lectin domain family 12 member B-like isoform X2 [Onychostoma macrolepis]|nr:C-type lectin domain family 12 member B-like isoform X2 [Onychostoma macrolepis]
MDTGARQKKTDDLYENVDAMRGKITMEINDPNTTRIQPSEHTGSDCVKIRSSRSAVVCLVLLCVLLLTAVIVLCVTLTRERQQLISKNENLITEREQLILKNTNLTNEREQIISKIENLTNEREQLILKNTNLTNERDQLRNELQICVGWTCYQSSFYYKSNEQKNWTESRRYCTERSRSDHHKQQTGTRFC